VRKMLPHFVNGVVLLAGIAVLTALYRQAKAAEGIEAGRKWGYFVIGVIVMLILMSMGQAYRVR
jgi:uncharacterized membrane protein